MLTVGSFGAGYVFSWSGILQLYPVHNSIFFLLAIMSLVFGISAFASCWYSVRYLATSVWLEETGISKKQFGKTVIFLPWSEIRFAGICTKYSPQGEKKRYCLAPWVLTHEERKNLDSAAKKVIYFSSLSSEELAYIKARCPLEIGSDAEQFLRHEKKR